MASYSGSLIGGDAAYGMGGINGGDSMFEVAEKWGESAQNSIGYLSKLAFDFNSYQRSFNFDLRNQLNHVPAMYIPAGPTTPDTGYQNPSSPLNVNLLPITPATLPGVPAFDKTLIIDTSGQPGPAPDNDIGVAPPVVRPTIPTAPEYVDPTVPSLIGINIPAFEPLEDIDVSIESPVFDATLPPTSIDYDDVLYTSDLLDTLVVEVSRVVNGDLGIPAYIWDALWDRTANNVRREGVTRERQARRNWSRLNWAMPGGTALAGAEAASHDVNVQTTQHALEVAVQDATMKREDFWSAVQQGVALESLLSNIQAQYQQRLLTAAIADQQAAVAVYQAIVAQFNASVNLVNAQVQAQRLLIENERLTLESNRLLIEKAVAEGQGDMHKIQLYSAEWDGIKTAVTVYSAEVDAMRGEIDAQRLMIDAHGQRIQQQGLLLQQWAIEWDGYKSKLEGENIKASVYDSEVKAFGERIRAYSAEITGDTQRVGSDIAIQDLSISRGSLDIERYKSEWAGIAAKLDSAAKIHQSEADVYSAEIQAQSARIDSDVRLAALQVDYDKANQGGEMENAKLIVAQLMKTFDLALESLTALGNVHAQLASSAYSALNFSSSDSRSSSNTKSQTDSNTYASGTTTHHLHTYDETK